LTGGTLFKGTQSAYPPLREAHSRRTRLTLLERLLGIDDLILVILFLLFLLLLFLLSSLLFLLLGALLGLGLLVLRGFGGRLLLLPIISVCWHS